MGKTIKYLLVCGHGHFDLASYDKFLSGEIADFEYPEEKIASALERLPVLN